MRLALLHRMLLLALAAGLTTTRASAQPASARGPLTPAYLNGMPRVEQVLDGVTGGDARETAIRRMAAFHQLRRMIEKASDGRVFSNQLTADETHLMDAYARAVRDIASPFTGDRSIFAERSKLETSEDYRDELLETLFASDWADWYLQTTGAADRARRRAITRDMGKGFASSRAEFGEAPEDFWIGQAVLAGLLLAFAFWRERRRFAFDESGPDVLHAGGRRYQARTVTGLLSDVVTETHRERTSRYEGDKLISVSEHTVTSVSCTLIALDEPGGTYEVPGFYHTWLKEGDRASLVWLTRMGRERGRFLLLLDHTQDLYYADRDALGRALRPRAWPAWALAWAGFALTRLAAAGTTLMLPYWVGLVLLLGYLVWRRRRRDQRVESCFSAILDTLRPRLNRHAAELTLENG